MRSIEKNWTIIPCWLNAIYLFDKEQKKRLKCIYHGIRRLNATKHSSHDQINEFDKIMNAFSATCTVLYFFLVFVCLEYGCSRWNISHHATEMMRLLLFGTLITAAACYENVTTNHFYCSWGCTLLLEFCLPDCGIIFSALVKMNTNTNCTLNFKIVDNNNNNNNNRRYHLNAIANAVFSLMKTFCENFTVKYVV